MQRQPVASAVSDGVVCLCVHIGKITQKERKNRLCQKSTVNNAMAKAYKLDLKQTWQTCNFCSLQTFKSSTEFVRYGKMAPIDNVLRIFFYFYLLLYLFYLYILLNVCIWFNVQYKAKLKCEIPIRGVYFDNSYLY